MDTQKPYDRKPQESTKAFEAFCVYRDLGADRSLDKARQKLGKKEGYRRQLEEWSSQYGWVERVKAWDADIDKIVQERLKEQQANAKEEAIKRHIALAQNMQQLGYKVLVALNEKVSVIGPNAMIRLLKEGIGIEREALEIENQKRVDITTGGEKITPMLYLPEKDKDTDGTD